MERYESPYVLERIRETISVYLACARLAAGTLYADGLLDAVEALGGSREDPPVPVARLLDREQDVAGEALGPMLTDLEERLAEIQSELAARPTGRVADSELTLAAG
jgi:hypothetical protein